MTEPPATEPPATEPPALEPPALEPPAPDPGVNAKGPSRLRRALAPFVGPAAVLAIYALVRFAYTSLSDGDGVLTPTGSLDDGLAALAFATLVLRMLALVVVPFVVVYRFVVRVLGPRARPYPSHRRRR